MTTAHQHRPAETDPLGPCAICGADPLRDFLAGREHRRSPETPVRKPRHLHDLPIFGWAWTEDARQVER